MLGSGIAMWQICCRIIVVSLSVAGVRSRGVRVVEFGSKPSCALHLTDSAVSHRLSFRLRVLVPHSRHVPVGGLCYVEHRRTTSPRYGFIGTINADDAT